MDTAMFCYQCEQTAGGKGCTGRMGVCGKDAATAGRQPPGNPERIAEWYRAYEDLKRTRGVVDFDDLLLKTVELFDKAPTVRERYAR